MSEIHLRKYGVEATIDFRLFEVDGVDFRVDAADGGSDCSIMKDEGAEATCTNDFTDEGTGYSLVLTATEMQAARIVVYVIDSATKVWLDTSFEIETYGNASAMHAVDLDDSVRAGLTALPNAAADAAGGLPISDAGGLDLDAMDTNINDIETDTSNMQPKLGTPAGADMSADIAAVQSDTDDIQSRIPAALSSGNMKTDVLAISGTTAEADKLEEVMLGVVNSTAATGTLSTTQMTTNLTEATDDHYNGRQVVFVGGVLDGQATDITDYDGASKMITMTAVTEAPVNGQKFNIV